MKQIIVLREGSKLNENKEIGQNDSRIRLSNLFLDFFRILFSKIVKYIKTI